MHVSIQSTSVCDVKLHFETSQWHLKEHCMQLNIVHEYAPAIGLNHAIYVNYTGKNCINVCQYNSANQFDNIQFYGRIQQKISLS